MGYEKTGEEYYFKDTMAAGYQCVGCSKTEQCIIFHSMMKWTAFWALPLPLWWLSHLQA